MQGQLEAVLTLMILQITKDRQELQTQRLAIHAKVPAPVAAAMVVDAPMIATCASTSMRSTRYSQDLISIARHDRYHPHKQRQ